LGIQYILDQARPTWNPRVVVANICFLIFFLSPFLLGQIFVMVSGATPLDMHHPSHGWFQLATGFIKFLQRIILKREQMLTQLLHKL
jgi:hypothetical protein